MAIANAIAQFGMNAGQNIQNSVQTGLQNAMAMRQEREGNRRYDNALAIRAQEVDLAKQQATEQAEREYGGNWAKAYFSASPEQRQAILSGGLQGAISRGYMAPEEAQAVDESYMMRLAAETGYDFRDPRGGAPAGIQEFNYLTDGLSEEDAQTARRIRLGLDPRAQGSGALTIIDQGMTDAVANSEGKISQSKSRGSAEGKGQGVRAQDEITRGLEIAKGVPSIKRGLDLLKLVDTGGLDAARIRAKQAFGIESADEGELSNLVGKAVLSQLRETFGAQFTANEGAELARIEAGLGKNNATNTRLLSNALTLANVAVNRALRMAEDRGDFETVMAINEYLNTDLGSAIESGQSASGSNNKPGEFKSSSGITFTVED